MSRAGIMSAVLAGLGVRDNDFDSELKTVHGLEKIDLMLKFMIIVEGHATEPVLEKGLNDLKSWLELNLKRSITAQEEVDLLQGLHDYVVSDPATPERNKTMDYLFNAKFLTPPSI